MNQPISRHVDFRLVPLGVSPTDSGCYFSVWSPKAEQIVVHLYDKSEHEIRKVSLPEKKGSVWYGFIDGVRVGDLYGYEAIGEYDPLRGLYFMRDHILVDPYAKALSKPFVYTEDRYKNHYDDFIPKAIVCDDSSFDWQGIEKPAISMDDLLIYECNVKGMTMLNEDVPSEHRGKFLGMCHEKVIAHLKRLGITAIQLNPIYAYISEPHLAKLGKVNYWGYNPVCYFAPDPRFAVNPRNAVNEFKEMVREFHRNGIAVILDVVYNHTGEGGNGGSVLSLKGFDAHNYYVHPRNEDGSTDFGNFFDVTGCGNSVNVDSRPTLNLVLKSMTHWLEDMKVDGFRFDLCVTLCRETHGEVFNDFDPNCAFLKGCFCNDSINKSILIAEPWDVGNNGYHVGGFPQGWAEQNDRFRDTVRRFWRGEKGLIGEYITRIMGSRDIYLKETRSIKSSLNFVTYHDGFTLHDLVSYNTKHNEANGENNRDGSNNNYSTNCGREGPTADKKINAKRWQMKRNLIASTILSQGIPHLLGGDEFSRTQQGNNNAYCQDNEISWTKWDYSDENRNFISFISMLNQIRHESMMLRELLLVDDSYRVSSKRLSYDAHWFRPDGAQMHSADWNNPNTDTVMLVAGAVNDEEGESWCVIFNQRAKIQSFKMPSVSQGREWVEIFNTATENGLPESNHAVKSVTTTCPCIRVFKLRNTVVKKIVDSTSIESKTRHSNRS